MAVSMKFMCQARVDQGHELGAHHDHWELHGPAGPDPYHGKQGNLDIVVDRLIIDHGVWILHLNPTNALERTLVDIIASELGTVVAEAFHATISHLLDRQMMKSCARTSCRGRRGGRLWGRHGQSHRSVRLGWVGWVCHPCSGGMMRQCASQRQLGLRLVLLET